MSWWWRGRRRRRAATRSRKRSWRGSSRSSRGDELVGTRAEAAGPRPHSLLPGGAVAAPRPELSVLPELLALWRGGDRTVRPPARRGADRLAHPALPSVFAGRPGP